MTKVPKHNKIVKSPRRGRISSMLNGLSERDLSFIESVIKSASVAVPLKEPIDIDTILATSEGKALLALAKQIRQTPIEFQLSELESLKNQNLTASWMLEDQFLSVDFEVIKATRGVPATRRDNINELVRAHLENCADGDATKIFSTSVQQEMEKDRKTLEESIRAFEKKKYTCPLKDLQIIESTAVSITLRLDDYWDPNTSLSTEVELFFKKTNYEYIVDYLQATIQDWIDGSVDKLEKELPAKAAAQFREVKNLLQELSTRTHQLADKLQEAGEDVNSLATEICERTA